MLRKNFFARNILISEKLAKLTNLSIVTMPIKLLYFFLQKRANNTKECFVCGHWASHMPPTENQCRTLLLFALLIVLNIPQKTDARIIIN